MRIIGLDLGEKRIGVAAVEDTTRVAIPIATVTFEGDQVEAVLNIVQEQRADEVVVGLPLSMTGAMGPQAERVMQTVRALEERLGIPVHTWDERLTSVQAGHRSHAERRRSRSRRPAGYRDAAAASILLQAYVDSGRPF